jgi:hypothetical protein
MRHGVVHRDAPSMTAASSRSFGIETKTWRIRKVPEALKKNGNTSDASESTLPSATIRW